MRTRAPVCAFVSCCFVGGLFVFVVYLVLIFVCLFACLFVCSRVGV